MGDPVDVGPVDDYPEGRTRLRVVGGRQIAVLRWRDGWYALRNVCPHRGAPLCANGGLVGPMLGETNAWDDDLRADPARPVLMCPWHRWEFDLSTGVEVRGKDRVKLYPVHVRDGRVLVELAAARPVAAERPA